MQTYCLIWSIVLVAIVVSKLAYFALSLYSMIQTAILHYRAHLPVRPVIRKPSVSSPSARVSSVPPSSMHPAFRPKPPDPGVPIVRPCRCCHVDSPPFALTARRWNSAPPSSCWHIGPSFGVFQAVPFTVTRSGRPIMQNIYTTLTLSNLAKHRKKHRIMQIMP